MAEYRVVIPEEEHVLFEFRQRDLPGFACVNVALRNFEPKTVFSWHLSVLIKCEELIENRLPSPDEQKILYDFEDALDVKIKENGNALFLSRVTHDAHREIMWRIHNPEITNAFLQEIIQNRRFVRPFDYRIDEDKMWDKAKWYLDNAMERGTRE